MGRKPTISIHMRLRPHTLQQIIATNREAGLLTNTVAGNVRRLLEFAIARQGAETLPTDQTMLEMMTKQTGNKSDAETDTVQQLDQVQPTAMLKAELTALFVEEDEQVQVMADRIITALLDGKLHWADLKEPFITDHKDILDKIQPHFAQ